MQSKLSLAKAYEKGARPGEVMSVVGGTVRSLRRM